MGYPEIKDILYTIYRIAEYMKKYVNGNPEYFSDGFDIDIKDDCKDIMDLANTYLNISKVDIKRVNALVLAHNR